jgi:DNA primase small subunit
MPHAQSPNPPSSPPVDDAIMSETVPDEQAESQNETSQSSPVPAADAIRNESLEDMFDDDDMDDDDDDEFTSSAAVKTQDSSHPATYVSQKPSNMTLSETA